MLRILKAASAAVCLAMAAPAWASVVDVDQIYQTGSGGSNGLGGLSLQTFTAGITGMLSQVDLQLFRAGLETSSSGAKISIVSTTNGLPDILWDRPTQTLTMATLGSTTLAPTATNGLNSVSANSGAFLSFDFSAANILLEAGTRYGIVVQQTDDVFGTLFWAGQSNVLPGGAILGPYADGQAGSLQFAASSTVPTLVDRTDNGFRTFVTPTAVPLPAGLPLLLVALGGIAILRRRT